MASSTSTPVVVSVQRKRPVFLSKRDRIAVVSMIAAGKTNLSIAEQFDVSSGLISNIRRANLVNPVPIPGEIWKPVVGFENRYSVSNFGRVIHRFNSFGNPVDRLLRPGKLCKGYVGAALYVNGRQIHKKVHSLVADAFIGPRPDGLQINHKNGIKHDNRPDNLEYVTLLENVRHAHRTGLGRPPKGNSHGMSKLTESQVSQIKRMIREGIDGVAIARLFGTHGGRISSIRTGKSWRHVE